MENLYRRVSEKLIWIKNEKKVIYKDENINMFLIIKLLWNN